MEFKIIKVFVLCLISNIGVDFQIGFLLELHKIPKMYLQHDRLTINNIINYNYVIMNLILDIY